MSRPQAVYAAPFYFAAVLDGSGRVRGCALRTPPFRLLLSRLPSEAIAPLVDDVAAWSSPPPAVFGEEPAATNFAEAWTALHGGSWRIAFRQRLYRLDELQRPARLPAGELRTAAEADVPLIAGWLESFERDAGMMVGDALPRARALVASRDAVLWVDGGEPVSLAAVTARTPRGARVGYVFTPAHARGRGYASACVAELSARLLAGGREFCCLFTDLANPVSNALYQRLGYRPVCDQVDCVLDGR